MSSVNSASHASAMRHSLAWSPEPGELQRLWRVIAITLPVFILLAIYISVTELPERDREELEKLPPQLAKVVLKKKQQPKPKPKPEPKPEKKPEVKKPPEPKPKPKIEAKPKPKPVPKKVREVTKPKINAKPEQVQKAREKAQQSGLLAMSSELSKLSALAQNVKLDTPKTITAKPIARKTSDKLASTASKTVASGGVNDQALSRSTQKVALAAREQGQVSAGAAVASTVAAESAKAKAKSRALASRSSEEIRRTMDANKSAIQRIYDRALRKQPSLQGVITPELVIEASGKVSSCTMAKSTLNEPGLEAKICKRLRLINFGAKPGIEPVTTRYSMDLLPG